MSSSTLTVQSPAPGVLVVDGFSKRASALRREFVARFENAESTRDAGGRFVWDFWHVPKKFRLLRTLPVSVFKRRTLNGWIQELAHFGREQLGVHGLTPFWLSCYTDGCEQRWHQDLPHGAWAFVYSLSPVVRGGETQIRSRRGQTTVKPKFNRLVVFDPSLVHRVRKVRGPLGVLEGRLVLHGWFVFPRPYVDGALPGEELQGAMQRWMDHLTEQKLVARTVTGTVVFRVKVGRSGRVSDVRSLGSTLRGWNLPAAQRFERATHFFWKRERFSRRAGASWLTVPLTC